MSNHFPRYHNKKSPITYSLSFAILLIASLVFTQSTSAQVMEGGQYKLQLNEVLDTEPTPTQTPSHKEPIVSPTVSPTPPPLQSYGQTEIVASDDFLQFGPLSPTDPVLRQLRFSVSSPELPFFLYQQMDHVLLSDPGQSIPATTCDNGSCTKNQAAPWNSTLTYGLGVRCENITETACPDDFVEKNTFRSLGLIQSNSASIIASGVGSEKNEFSLIYKLVVPGTQPPGTYQATATYVLIPGI